MCSASTYAGIVPKLCPVGTRFASLDSFEFKVISFYFAATITTVTSSATGVPAENLATSE